MKGKFYIDSDVVLSDAFMALPVTSQALYARLAANSNGDGFVINPRMLCKTYRNGKKYLQILIDGGFVEHATSPINQAGVKVVR